MYYPDMMHDTRLPSLSILRCFESAAKHESFTAAAEELGLTQGAVSRQVKELESQIGAPLFRREGRGIRLTDPGRALANQVLGDLDRLRHTIQHAIAAGSKHKVLSIAAPPTFASRWLVPRLKHFRARHPELELVLQSRAETFDLSDTRIDLAISFGSRDWPGARMTALCAEELVVVIAPELQARHNIQSAEDILRVPLLHLSSRPHLWDMFCQIIEAKGPTIRNGSYFDQFSLMISATLSSMGAAILPTFLIEEELASGALTKVLNLPDDQPHSYFIATPTGQASPLVQEFSTWLHTQVRRDQG